MIEKMKEDSIRYIDTFLRVMQDNMGYAIEAVIYDDTVEAVDGNYEQQRRRIINIVREIWSPLSVIDVRMFRVWDPVTLHLPEDIQVRLAVGNSLDEIVADWHPSRDRMDPVEMAVKIATVMFDREGRNV